jgi:hypothetical protein
MDLNRILQMIINTVLRRAVNGAVNGGINYFSGRGKSAADMTPEEKAQAAKGQDIAKRAKQVAKLTRRIGR